MAEATDEEHQNRDTVREVKPDCCERQKSVESCSGADVDEREERRDKPGEQRRASGALTGRCEVGKERREWQAAV